MLHWIWLIGGAILFLNIGFLIGLYTYSILAHSEYGGRIVVEELDGVIRYTLEVDDNPEQLRYRKEVLFEIVGPKESEDRD